MYVINNEINTISLNLLSPPASQTETSIALIWDKHENSPDIVGYQVYINGEIHGITTNTDYAVTNLKFSREYEAFIRAVFKTGELSVKSNTIKVTTKPKGEIFDITSFGAVGDGKTMTTYEIQRAIKACTPGGTVYVPKGTFLTGAIYLKRNMTLYIEEGGLLLGSCSTVDYPLIKYRWEGLETTCYSSLINTTVSDSSRLENLTITGMGKIDANSSILRKKELAENKGTPGRAICLRNVDNVYLKDITVKQSPAWCVQLIYCNNVSVNNMKICPKHDEYSNKYLNMSNDNGLNTDSTSNVFIFNSIIASECNCISSMW